MTRIELLRQRGLLRTGETLGTSEPLRQRSQTLGTSEPLRQRSHLRGANFGDAAGMAQITEQDIAEVVAKWTGIPVSKLQESEQQKLIRMEEVLHGRVIGQDEAVVATTVEGGRGVYVYSDVSWACTF